MSILPISVRRLRPLSIFAYVIPFTAHIPVAANHRSIAITLTFVALIGFCDLAWTQSASVTAILRAKRVQFITIVVVGSILAGAYAVYAADAWNLPITHPLLVFQFGLQGTL